MTPGIWSAVLLRCAVACVSGVWVGHGVARPAADDPAREPRTGEKGDAASSLGSARSSWNAAVVHAGTATWWADGSPPRVAPVAQVDSTRFANQVVGGEDGGNGVLAADPTWLVAEAAEQVAFPEGGHGVVVDGVPASCLGCGDNQAVDLGENPEAIGCRDEHGC